MSGTVPNADAAAAAWALWTYRRPFRVDGHAGLVVARSTMQGLVTILLIDGVEVARDHTPSAGPGSTRPHHLATTLPGGADIRVEAGFLSWLSVGIAVSRDGVLIHESHPGRPIALPERAARMMEKAGGGSTDGDYDPGALGRNRTPILVDIALGLIFYFVARATDLTTAALLAAFAGLALAAVQRLTKIDLLGGMALFGIVMLLISAGLAFAFQSDDAVKWRTTVMGLIGASLFFLDALTGGRRIGAGMARYLPYRDMDVRRLAFGMGTVGFLMALLNIVALRLLSTDAWLFYTTFVDIILIMAMATFVFQWARRRPATAT
jgi:intracellular septation protein A